MLTMKMLILFAVFFFSFKPVNGRCCNNKLVRIVYGSTQTTDSIIELRKLNRSNKESKPAKPVTAKLKSVPVVNPKRTPRAGIERVIN